MTNLLQNFSSWHLFTIPSSSLSPRPQYFLLPSSFMFLTNRPKSSFIGKKTSLEHVSLSPQFTTLLHFKYLTVLVRIIRSVILNSFPTLYCLLFEYTNWQTLGYNIFQVDSQPIQSFPTALSISFHPCINVLLLLRFLLLFHFILHITPNLLMFLLINNNVVVSVVHPGLAHYVSVSPFFVPTTPTLKYIWSTENKDERSWTQIVFK